MKLCSFVVDGPWGPSPRLGAVTSARVVDLNSATRHRLQSSGATETAAGRLADALCPTDVIAFIEGGPTTREAAEQAVQWAAGRDPEDLARPAHGPPAIVPLDGLRYLPAVPAPPLIRDFMAFEGHLLNIYPRLGREIPAVWYELPVYYKGNSASTGACGQDIPVPSYAAELDFEVEVAAVIGRGGADIARADALASVYGYTIYNDMSARAIQSREMSAGLGPAKGKDFRGGHVLGPWLVTADEVGDPYQLEVTARVNGELWTQASIADMHWRFEDMIAHASRDEVIRPAEIFGSGTVTGGSGAELGRSLRRGDEVVISCRQLGILRNRVV
jgi:2-keto-4-pentenoate hydratase/2-oxohepta-3-ene-1,7-dioic acid hydratase in catechol pathway